MPDQVPFIVKSTATVALQLLKRFRNIVYQGYRGRVPPSVVLSYFTAQVSRPTVTLSDTLVLLCRAVAMAIRHASARRERLYVLNPECDRDCFTDSWPESAPALPRGRSRGPCGPRSH